MLELKLFWKTSSFNSPINLRLKYLYIYRAHKAMVTSKIANQGFAKNLPLKKLIINKFCLFVDLTNNIVFRFINLFMSFKIKLVLKL